MDLDPDPKFCLIQKQVSYPLLFTRDFRYSVNQLSIDIPSYDDNNSNGNKGHMGGTFQICVHILACYKIFKNQHWLQWISNREQVIIM